MNDEKYTPEMQGVFAELAWQGRLVNELVDQGVMPREEALIYARGYCAGRKSVTDDTIPKG